MPWLGVGGLINLQLITGGCKIGVRGVISNKAMSKDGSEDVVMEEQGDGPATAMA